VDPPLGRPGGVVSVVLVAKHAKTRGASASWALSNKRVIQLTGLMPEIGLHAKKTHTIEQNVCINCTLDGTGSSLVAVGRRLHVHQILIKNLVILFLFQILALGLLHALDRIQQPFLVLLNQSK
jgi:hypothetical protein